MGFSAALDQKADNTGPRTTPKYPGLERKIKKTIRAGKSESTYCREKGFYKISSAR